MNMHETRDNRCATRCRRACNQVTMTIKHILRLEPVHQTLKCSTSQQHTSTAASENQQQWRGKAADRFQSGPFKNTRVNSQQYLTCDSDFPLRYVVVWFRTYKLPVHLPSKEKSNQRYTNHIGSCASHVHFIILGNYSCSVVQCPISYIISYQNRKYKYIICKNKRKKNFFLNCQLNHLR